VSDWCRRKLYRRGGTRQGIAREKRQMKFAFKSSRTLVSWSDRCLGALVSLLLTSLIYKPIPSWFVKAGEIRDPIVENNQQTYWVPDNVKEVRFHNWLAVGGRPRLGCSQESILGNTDSHLGQ
jgi:hypothetical protein